MADTKISAMLACMDVKNADILPIVQAGANFKATRTQLLTAGIGEAIFVTANGMAAAVLCSPTNQNEVQVSDAFGVLIHGDLGVVMRDALTTWNITITAAGMITISSSGGANTMFVSGGPLASMTMNDATQIVTFVCVNGMICPFVIQAPGAIGNWAIGVPADYNLAINRLAAAVAGLLGGPIP